MDLNLFFAINSLFPISFSLYRYSCFPFIFLSRFLILRFPPLVLYLQWTMTLSSVLDVQKVLEGVQKSLWEGTSHFLRVSEFISVRVIKKVLSYVGLPIVSIIYPYNTTNSGVEIFPHFLKRFTTPFHNRWFNAFFHMRWKLYSSRKDVTFQKDPHEEIWQNQVWSPFWASYRNSRLKTTLLKFCTENGRTLISQCKVTPSCWKIGNPVKFNTPCEAY